MGVVFFYVKDANHKMGMLFRSFLLELVLDVVIGSYQGTHNADSIIESKVIYYLEQCGLGV